MLFRSKDLEKIRKDIMAGNPSMSESMSYALATNILKKRKRAGRKGSDSKAKLKASRAYKAYEKSERPDVEGKESYAEVASEARKGMM